MVQYNDELKQEIRNANDIVDVISQYVILKRSGKNFMGLCPFHKEKSPSFSVSPDRQYYHCLTLCLLLILHYILPTFFKPFFNIFILFDIKSLNPSYKLTILL